MDLLEALPCWIIDRIMVECMDEDHTPDPDKLIALLHETGFGHLVTDTLENAVEELFEEWQRRDDERVVMCN